MTLFKQRYKKPTNQRLVGFFVFVKDVLNGRKYFFFCS